MTYALLGLVAFLLVSFIYFTRLVFGVMSREIGRVNRRLENLLDRQMAKDLTDYGTNQIRTQVIEESRQERILPPEPDKSYDGGMFV